MRQTDMKVGHPVTRTANAAGFQLGSAIDWLLPHEPTHNDR